MGAGEKEGRKGGAQHRTPPTLRPALVPPLIKKWEQVGEGILWPAMDLGGPR